MFLTLWVRISLTAFFIIDKKMSNEKASDKLKDVEDKRIIDRFWNIL